jgi:hypothetical protein
MSVAAWITAFGIVVGAIVTLSVAYLHRKQMRQIELHRADPIVPVTPPPHAVTVFLKQRWYLWYSLLFGGFDLGMLITDLNKTTPVTRGVVFDITLGMIGVTLMALMPVAISTFSVLNRAGETASKTIDVLVAMSDRIKKIEKNIPPQMNQH